MSNPSSPDQHILDQIERAVHQQQITHHPVIDDLNRMRPVPGASFQRRLEEQISSQYAPEGEPHLAARQPRPARPVARAWPRLLAAALVAAVLFGAVWLNIPRSQSTLTPLAQQITALPSIPPPTLVPTALAVPMGMLPVVMTTHDITWGTRAAEALEQHAFVTAYMPADQVPADAVQNVDDLKDQHITRSLIAGEIVRASDLREQPYPPGVRPDDMAVSEIPRSWLANDASTLLPWTPVQIRVLLFNMDRLVSISLPPARVMQADSTSLSVALPLDQHILFDRLTAAGRESFISFSLTPLDSDPALNSPDNAVAFAPEESGSCGRVAVETHDSPWNSPLLQGTITRGFSGTHTGIDFEAPRGSSVQAASTGRVLFAGYSSWGYGNTVVLSHGALITLYAHMDEILVACGQLVQAGDIVGTLGSTGNSSGPHLHFEIRQDDSTIDPLLLPILAEQQSSAGQVLPP